MKLSKPDYKFWSKLDSWKLKDASMLLHGIDPHLYRSLRFNAKDIPPQLIEAHKTYLILCSVDWQQRHPLYQGYHYNEVHPYAACLEAHRKELPMPVVLRTLVGKRYDREQKNREENAQNDQKQVADNNVRDSTSLTTRERSNLLKAIGILVKLFIDSKSSKNPHATQLSAYQISQRMLEKADALGVKIEGLKSFDRKITEALSLLEDETTFPS